MRLGHVPALDALRGIAILLVLAGHADGALPGGALGVDLFFVLSGFLITSLLLDEWHRGDRISLGDFYRRRAFRLLPALVTMLLVILVVSLAVGNARTELVWASYSLGYIINLMAIEAGGIDADNLQHMWSLSHEEQFYLVWPPLLVLALRTGMSGRAISLFLGVVAVYFFAYRGALETLGAPTGYLWYSPDTRSGGLILGCLAGVMFSHGLVRRIPLWLPTLSLVPMCFALSTLSFDSHWHAVYLLPAFTVGATLVLLAVVLHPESWLARLIDRAGLRGLGRISYGLYLWHWPLYYAFGWKLGLPLALLVALVSYRFVEQPFLRRRHARPGRAQSAPVAVPAVLQRAS
jgi:peptidoglycan/LPS O-acetylase OafA/YrhL